MSRRLMIFTLLTVGLMAIISSGYALIVTRAQSKSQITQVHTVYAQASASAVYEDWLLYSTENAPYLTELIKNTLQLGDANGVYISKGNAIVYSQGKVGPIGEQDIPTLGTTGEAVEISQRSGWELYVVRVSTGYAGRRVTFVFAPPEEQNAVLLNLALITVLGMVVSGGVSFLLARRWLIQPITALATQIKTAAGRLAQGDTSALRETQIAPHEVSEIQSLRQTYSTLAEHVQSYAQSLRDVNRDLERRSAYLEASAKVGGATTSILETDKLIRQAVELVLDQFNLYYVGLFQTDESHEWAMLRAGTGKAGQAMLARGHRIRIGEGMVGWSIANAQARVALDVQGTGADAVRLATAELPDTRSEAAIPLRSRGQVLGALTVQSDQPGTFDQVAVAALQTMADQLAVALDNARLLAESQTALEATRRAYGEISREGWLQLIRARPTMRYLCDSQGIKSVTGQWQPEMVQAIQEDRVVQNGGPTIAIPIKVRDRVFGVVRLRKPDGAEKWTAEEVVLMETLTEQLSVALENARLHQDTQSRAEREQLMGEITTRIRETLDIETVLKTAAHQVRQSLNLPEVVIRLGSAPPTSHSPRDGHNGDEPAQTAGKERTS